MQGKRMLIIIFIGIFLVGCQIGSQRVALKNNEKDIVCIELMYDKSHSVAGDQEALYVLDENEVEEFVEALCDLEVHTHWSPSGGFGRLFVEISYKDGSKEVIGVSAIEYISSTGEQEFDDWHYVDYYDIYDLFSLYVEKELLPSHG